MDYVKRSQIKRGLDILKSLIENDDIGVATGYIEALYEQILIEQFTELDNDRQMILSTIKGIHSK